MTRFHPAAKAARTLRALVGAGAMLILAVVASGCMSSQAPAPTPDPFAGLADRSDQAFRQGLESYGQGQYREALNAFEQARTLSPKADPRIDQMIERSRGAMAPTPTAVPPTPTSLPATPTATPVAMSTLTPDTDLGQRYFGKVNLVTVPGKDSDVPAATQFFFQDQVGLRIEGLKQHLRLPFTVRVFNTDTGSMIAQVNSYDSSRTTSATASPTAAASSKSASTSQNASASATPVATSTGAAQDFQVVRFWDSYVWYHHGGEEPGRYRLELYANGVLTNSFDYSVGTVPVPTPSPEVQSGQPALEAPTSTPLEEIAPPPPAPPAPAAPSRPVQSAPVAAPKEPAPTPQPTAMPSPTPIPTPAKAYTMQVGGVAAGLDVDSDAGRFYLADSSGVIWTTDAQSGQERPTLGAPISIGGRSPVDLTIDQTTGYLYLSTRVCAPAAPGCIVALDGRNGGSMLRSIALPGVPSEVRVDSQFGVLFVAVPDRQALVQVDVRSGNVLRTISGLPQITSMALDSARHTLYAAHLGGQVTVVDVPTGQVLARPSMTGAGLASIATARGLVYGVNTATHELAVLEPASQAVSRYPLTQEPAAVAAAEDTGAVYVLSSRSDVILQLDPTDGSELGRVLVASRSGHLGLGSSAELQTLRPRLVLDPATDAIFASLPEEGQLAAVGNDQFPTLSRSIPFVEAPAQPLVASVPSVVWPGDPSPSQPAPTLRAQAPDPQPTTDDTDQEGI